MENDRQTRYLTFSNKNELWKADKQIREQNIQIT